MVCPCCIPLWAYVLGGGFFAKYWGKAVARYPRTSISVASGFIAAAGDLAAQGIEHYKNKNKDKKFRFDGKRSLQMFTFGSVFTGLPMILWFKFAGTNPAMKSGPTWWRVTKQTVATNAIYAPVITSCFFSFMAAVNAKKKESIVSDAKVSLKKNFLPAYLDSLKVWVPANALLFSVIPPSWQVIVSNSIGAAWNVYLSMAAFKAPAPTTAVESSIEAPKQCCTSCKKN